MKEKLTNHTTDTDSKYKIEMKQLISELNSIALEWKSSRNKSECKCETLFDAFNKKVNHIDIITRLPFNKITFY